MYWKTKNTIKLLSSVSLVAGLLITFTLPAYASSVPDFSSYRDVKQKKHAFFNYFRPIVRNINKQRLAERKQLHAMLEQLDAGKRLDKSSLQKLDTWLSRYSIENKSQEKSQLVRKLLNHLDALPEAMVLAQAANESAWGTSRFAKKGNNYFGQWCYKKGCGLVPSARDKGTRHEVRKFNSPKESVLAYFRNINSHRTYKKVREIRAALREKGEKLSAIKMVAGLINYSQRRESYIKELRSMIRFNKLEM